MCEWCGELIPFDEYYILSENPLYDTNGNVHIVETKCLSNIKSNEKFEVLKQSPTLSLVRIIWKESE